MFSKVLIANRGAISCRIQRTLRRMGVTSVAVYSEADADSLHVRHADESVCLGSGNAQATYLDIARIIAAARNTGAEAIHPGYGFLSENTDFARACEAAGIAFIGPTPEQIDAFGLKHTARALAQQSGVPLLPGSGLLADVGEALVEAERIGYPVMLKSTAGGGGIGMQRCHDAAQLRDAFDSVQRLSRNNFSNDGLFLEKLVVSARHIEVQIFGDGAGEVVALGERDCSLQRRNQKVVEETPAPNLPDAVRQQMLSLSRQLGRTVAYRNAGTVEFIYDAHNEQFYFLEVNSRLQVEHGVTEEVTGVDLVEWMVRLAAGETDFIRAFRYRPQGHAVQVRVYAEDPGKQFKPSAGLLTQVMMPDAVRCDTWVDAGVEVSPLYDPMLAKIIAKGATRDEAIARLASALESTRIRGIETNLAYLRDVIATPVFLQGEQTTAFLNDFTCASCAIDVLDGGTLTTVQDYPGRQGYWSVGVPPSGPFDSLSMRLANRLLGNDDGVPALEMTLSGATLSFRADTDFVLGGAEMQATLNGVPVPCWQVQRATAGDVLRCGQVRDAGSRCYLAVAGGFDVPAYLGSASTFTLGRFGGHAGRALRSGDVLHVKPANGRNTAVASLPEALRPALSGEVTLHVLYGPHAAPDFFTEQDIDMLLDTAWEVHYNSSRTGVRLVGPTPQWARSDGGEAGLHPSNIHDNAYAIGAIDFTGDMPVILGPDGPSLGGFVCPVTLIKADLWKLGQLRAGDRVRFVVVTQAEAEQREQQQNREIATLQAQTQSRTALPVRLPEPAVLHQVEPGAHPVGVTYRVSGDDNILVEYGPQVLDLGLRLRVHALMEYLGELAHPAILQLTPGIRSLQINYDNLRLPRHALLALLQDAEASLADLENRDVPTRIVHLPISWDDAACHEAIAKYMQSVRKDAPWCPSNLEFIRRINGLDSVDEVRRIFFDASYLVMGLGDVYLGAPVATPLDPRHRLVTTKYNPARTWTPENAVGIGGAYLCVYGMEGPGGYQFVGRTLQMWNTWRSTDMFEPGKPWLLRFFDQLRFYPVSHEELVQIREDFPRGRYSLRTEESVFNLRDYNAFLEREADSIDVFRQRQRRAFAEERQRWEAAGQPLFVDDAMAPEPAAECPLADHEVAVQAGVPGSLWQWQVAEGDRVTVGQTVAILESMKMEIPLQATADGVVTRLLCQPGQMVSPGQRLMVVAHAAPGRGSE